jgi:hypothetical protein
MGQSPFFIISGGRHRGAFDAIPSGKAEDAAEPAEEPAEGPAAEPAKGPKKNRKGK